MARQKTQPPLLAPQCHAPPAAARSAYLAPPSVPVQDLRTQRMNVHLALHLRNTPGCADISARPAGGFPIAATDRHRRDFCICRPGHRRRYLNCLPRKEPRCRGRGHRLLRHGGCDRRVRGYPGRPVPTVTSRTGRGLRWGQIGALAAASARMLAGAACCSCSVMPVRARSSPGAAPIRPAPRGAYAALIRAVRRIRARMPAK